MALTLEQFKQRFAWRETELSLGRPLEWLWHCRLEAPPERLWPILVDTSKLNRALKFPLITYQQTDRGLQGSVRYLGIRHDWVEPPWNWLKYRYMECRRFYSRGLAKMFRGVLVLDSIDTKPGEQRQTDLYFYFGWIPRGLLGRLLIGCLFGLLRSSYIKQARRAATFANNKISTATVTSPFDHSANLNTFVRLRLDEKLALLAISDPVSGPKVAERLGDLIKNADSRDVFRLRPKTLARRWNLPWPKVFQHFLKGVELGILTTSWDIICPHCRNISQSFDRLGALPAEGYCHSCQSKFDSGIETSIELGFRIADHYRHIERIFYCAAEPAYKQHIWLQYTFIANERITVKLDMPFEKYLRLRCLDGNQLGQIAVGFGESKSLSIALAEQSQPALTCALNAELKLHNNSNKIQTYVIEDTTWEDDAVHPAEVFSRLEFRKAFAADLLAPDLRVNAGNKTIVFTDIVQSEELFHTLADAEAFRLLRDHFHNIDSIVSKREGAVVKLLGDGCMLVFDDAEQAVRASFEIATQAKAMVPPLHLRIAIHSGVCLLANLNGCNDFFGKTVILAARLLEAAPPNYLLLSGKTLNTGLVKTSLYAHEANIESFHLPEAMQKFSQLVYATRL